MGSEEEELNSQVNKVFSKNLRHYSQKDYAETKMKNLRCYPEGKSIYIYI